jgi:hypothetical protein
VRGSSPHEVNLLRDQAVGLVDKVAKGVRQSLSFIS